MSTGLEHYLHSHKFTLSHLDAKSGKVTWLKNNGVDDLLICMAGLGRSPDGARMLSGVGIMAIALEGGLNDLAYVSQDQKLIRELNKFKRISLILNNEERCRVNGQYYGLRVFEHFEHNFLVLGSLAKLLA